MSLKLLTQTSILCAAILSVSCGSGNSGDTTDNTDNTTDNSVQKTGSALADGYLAFATVCLDTSGDKSCADEDSSLKETTDENGSFTMSALAEQYAQFALVVEAEAGTAKEDGNDIPSKLVLSAPIGETDVVSPLTTLAESYLQANASLTSADAEDKILEDLEVTDTAVSIYDDYIAQLAALSSSEAVGAIAVGAVDGSTTQADFTLLRQVAQVASLSIQDNIRTVQEAITAGDSTLNLNNNFRSLMAVIGNDVIEQVADIASQARAAGINFTPANLVRILNIADVEVAVVEQEAAASATAVSVQDNLSDGVSFFGFEDAVSGSNSFPFMEQQTFTLVPAATTGTLKKKKTISQYNLELGQFDPLASNNNGSVPSNGTWETRRGIDITFNADGSAIVNTLGRSLKQQSITTDVSGLNIRAFVSPGMKAYASGQFATGAKAIRPTFTFLKDYYVIRPTNTANINTFPRDPTTGAISTASVNAVTLDDLLTPVANAFDFTNQIALNNNADPADDVSPKAAFFDNINPRIKFTVELIGDAGAVSGTAEFYEYNFADRTNSGYHRITHIASGTWQRRSISLGNDGTGTEQFADIITTDVPAIIRQQTFSPEFEKIKRTRVFTEFNGLVRRGRFVPEGTVTTKQNWRFNSVATANIIASVGNLVDFFPVTNLSTLQKGDAFNLQLSELSDANALNDYGSQPFIRADDLVSAELVGNFEMTSSLFRNFTDKLFFNSDGTGTLIPDPNDGGGNSSLTQVSISAAGQLTFTENDEFGSLYTWTLTPVVPSRYGDNAILEVTSSGDLIAGDSGFEDITMPVKIKALVQ